MTNKQLMHFYLKNNPYVSSTEKIGKVFFCYNKFVPDSDCNFAYIEGKADINDIENYYKSKNRKPSVYCINSPYPLVKNYNVTVTDDWLVCNNIKALYSKYASFNLSDFNIEKVTLNNIAERDEISTKGFEAEGADNPYSYIDHNAYTACLLDKFKTKSEDELISFLIKYKNKTVASINFSIEGTCCYISGYTVLPEYRRTKAGLGVLLTLDYLIKRGIQTVFCITEKEGYPNKLYKNLGFISAFTGKIYTK